MKRIGENSFECQCCRAILPLARLGAYAGAGEINAVCLSCYGVYLSVGADFPDDTLVERLNRVRLLRAIEELSEGERQKLRKLDFLLRNRSARAGRLSAMAMSGRISLSRLLAMV